jgi:predicted AAA+ superfamily ATPase
MLRRTAHDELLKRLAAYPAVALVGPRQCGKTTLARSIKSLYFDLEQEADRLRLDLAWDDVTSGNQLVILDEAQEWPELFPRLRGAIDAERKRNGRFLLLGSVSPALMTHVSESLAGRLSLLELTPLLRSELPQQKRRGLHWLYGGYPDGGILDPERYPRWELDYLLLLSQRDLPNWGLPARTQTTDRLLRMLAALHGQAWNASQVGQSLGISYHTVNSYLDFLSGAFLIRRLSPWQANLGKRLIKSPKVYWRDTGLLHAIHGVTDQNDLLGQPWVGASWEGYVIEQTIGEAVSRGIIINPWFFRTSDGREIDLLLEFGRDLWAIEIKLTTSPTTADLDRLERTAALVGASHRFLVSQTTRPTDGEFRASLNLQSLLDRITGRAGKG